MSEYIENKYLIIIPKKMSGKKIIKKINTLKTNYS